MPMEFDGTEYMLCYDGLNASFKPALNPVPTDLIFLLKTWEIDIQNLVSLWQPLNVIVMTVIEHMQAKDLHYELALEAHKWRPRNEHLTELKRLIEVKQSKTQWSVAEQQNRDKYEAYLNKSKEFLDPVTWHRRFGPLLYQICRIELAGDEECHGTGFLIGPDVVMTNCHVLNEMRKKPAFSPAAILLRFDFHKGSKGKCFRLKDVEDERWLLDSSPPAGIDNDRDAFNVKKENLLRDSLDYALLRVANAPGATPIVDSPGGSPDERGWIDIRPDDTDTLVAEGDILFIVQYPGQRTLSQDFDIVTQANEVRVRYTTNTDGGSSGSPCFDRALRLVALHHFGSEANHYNQGIPLNMLRTHWREQKATLLQNHEIYSYVLGP